MAANTNPNTGVPYGIIKADSLHPDKVHEMMYVKGNDVSYKVAETEYIAEKRQEWQAKVDERQERITELEKTEHSDDIILSEPDQAELNALRLERAVEEQMPFDPEQVDTQEFEDSYQCDEPQIEGEIDSVHYGTSWLGGALLFYVFQSPYITHRAAQCSPCVPGAGDLDSLGHFTCYTFPPEWFADEYLLKLAQTEGWDFVEKKDGSGWMYYYVDEGFVDKPYHDARFKTCEEAALFVCKTYSVIGAGPFPVPAKE